MNKNYLLLLLLFTNRMLAQDCVPPGPIAGDTGCVTFAQDANEITYTTVRGKDGKIWLQQNLGSQSVATSATDENGYGDLYQWGRWTDGHQKRNAANAIIAAEPNNPTGIGPGVGFYTSSPEWWAAGTATDQWKAETPEEITANNGCDPCKALGINWNVPTKSDWETIIAAENITNIATAFQSSLKLTIAGSKLPSGSFNYTGVRGYYWSKTTSDNDNYAKYLYYSNFIVNPSAGSVRAQGLSVRCVFAEALGTQNFQRNNCTIYPNPTNGSITIQASETIKSVRVFNLLGQLVASQKSATIEIANQASGIYIVQVDFENGTTAQQKIIKQ